MSIDAGLAVIAAEDDCVSLEKLVATAGGVDKRRDGCVAARERLVRRVGTAHVRGEVVVGQVVGEKVEVVTRDEPAPDGRRVAVDRAGTAGEHRKRRAGALRFEQVVVEEVLRPVGRDRNRRQGRKVRRAASVARDVDRGGRQARVFEHLEQRGGPARQVLSVHVDDRVEYPARHSGGTQRGERRAVLDDPPLAPVVPDEMGNVVHIGMRACDERREADGRQRRERRHRTVVAALLGEERQRGCALVAHRRLEHRRREAVDDDQDEPLRVRLSLGQESAVPHSAQACGRAGARRAPGREWPRRNRHRGSTRVRRSGRQRRLTPGTQVGG